jgi:hypothetical protein
MRLVKDRILYIWEQRRPEAKDRTVEQEKRVKLTQQKLDRLDDAFPGTAFQLLGAVRE